LLSYNISIAKDTGVRKGDLKVSSIYEKCFIAVRFKARKFIEIS